MAYRDGGFWTLVWHAFSSLWRHGHSATFPPDGFVGLVSSSSAATDPRPRTLTSVALRKVCTSEGRHWRLTYGWEIPLHRSHPSRSGQLSDEPGRQAPGDDGGETSSPRITTTSIWDS